MYFVQNQVGLHSQKKNEQDNQAHNMLSQLPAATDRKVKQQYNWKNEKKLITASVHIGGHLTASEFHSTPHQTKNVTKTLRQDQIIVAVVR